MAIQLIETQEVMLEVIVREDESTLHLMAPDSHLWSQLAAWFGNMKLVHQITFSIYESVTPRSSADSVTGRVVTAIASSPALLAKLPSSAIGYKINEMNRWIEEGLSDADADDDQRIVISGNDFEVKENGAVWIAGLGVIPVTLTGEQIARGPVSIELLADPLGDSDTVALAVNYSDELAEERHLKAV